MTPAPLGSFGSGKPMTPAPLYPPEVADLPQEAYAFIPPNLTGLEEAVRQVSLHAPASPGEPNAALSARMRIAELVWVGRNRWFLAPQEPYARVFYRTLIKELAGSLRSPEPSAPGSFGPRKPTAEATAAKPPKPASKMPGTGGSR